MPFRDLPNVSICRFRRGDILIHAGEKVEYVYYLIKGTVYREWVSINGHESILNSKASGNIVQSLVGIMVLYSRVGRGVSNYSFIARTNCLCYRIPAEVCINYLRQHPDLQEEVIHTIMDSYRQLLTLFQAKAEGCVASKLCGLLLERGQETEQGLFISKKFTNIEMGRLLAVHKGTIGRILRTLKEEGTVVRTAEGLLLQNPQRLQQYADNEIKLKYR